MIKVKLVTKYRNINNENGIYFSGACFNGNNLLSTENVFNELSEVSTLFQFETILNRYNGFFAFVINHEYECFIAVDRIRSIPLFYGKKEFDLYISNEVEWIRHKIGARKINHLAEQEFIHTGYVTGQDTLYENIKQLQAGEYLYFRQETGAVITNRYYRFLHKEPEMLPEFKYCQNKLDMIMNEVIKRLILYANGRQIVIPLSAGRDSRLIALKLKQFGYQNILCFSYGISGNFEAETSKKIADLLGFTWVFIEYTRSIMKTWFDSPERKEYDDMACNYSSISVIQDWQAVWELKNQGVIKKDAIFVPGHSGDFPAGSHIPFDAQPDEKASLKNLIAAIKENHYSLAYWTKKTKKTVFWKNRIREICEVNCVNNGYDYANFFEKWDWQERQAKFIVNSVRAYEYWGYEWWLPFWDNDFVFFWEKMPLKYRKNKLLYNDYVDSLTLELTGGWVSGNINHASTSSIKNIVKSLLHKMHIYQLVRHLLFWRKRKVLSSDIITRYFLWVFTPAFISKNRKKTNQVDGLFVINYIDSIK